jgi:hypothetical protein
MQKTNLTETPVTNLLNLLCKERIEQYYHYQVQSDEEYTTITFCIKENLLSASQHPPAAVQMTAS